MKRLSSFLLAISFILLIIPFTALLAAADNPSGSCGDHATWTFGSGTLVISGSGDMDDFVLLPWAFYKDEIKYVLVQDGITRICDNAFKNCTALELASIPDTVEFIGESAFENCTKLAEIILPKNLKTIDINAFKGCTAFTEITIPKKVTTIELGAFDDCKKISKITYEPVNIDSVSTCFANVGSQTSGVTVSFGEDVTVVPSNIFKDCTNVTAVSFGSNIEIIGREAFMGCTGLQNVTLPNSLREIDIYAFKCCYAFTEITI